MNEIKKMNLYPTHILHLSASRVTNQRFHKGSVGGFQNEFQIQVDSVRQILQVCIPNMVEQKYGKIVFMLSSCTVGTPPSYWTGYVTVKYALFGLMKALAVEYSGKGINVNGISPSMIETEFLNQIPELVVQQNAQNHPLKRNAAPVDIIPVIQFLFSDQAEYISGHNLMISRGSVL